jgi:hypothetical protein
MKARTAAMMDSLREERRARANGESDARKVFRSEIRSGVHALLERCEMTREALASDIHADGEAFRKARPTRKLARTAGATASASDARPKRR